MCKNHQVAGGPREGRQDHHKPSLTVTTKPHNHHDGHSHRPRLTLLPLRLRCIRRPTSSFRKTPTRLVIVIVFILVIRTDANHSIHNNQSSTRGFTPRLYPNQNPNPFYTIPERNGPDCDTWPSRPKLGQRPHNRLQHRDRRPRTALRSSGLDPLPTLQTEEATAYRLARRGSTTTNPELSPEHHQTILRRYPVGCFPQVKHQTSPDTHGLTPYTLRWPDLYVYLLLLVYYCMCLRSGGIDSISVIMGWSRFSQPTGLHLTPGGGGRALRKERVFPAPDSETDGTRIISNQVRDTEDQ